MAPSRSIGFSFDMDEGSLKDLLQTAKELPEKVERKVLRSAGRKAATTLLNIVKGYTPKAKKKPWKYIGKPHLRDALAVKQKTYGRGGQSRTVFVIGPRSNQAPHAHLVEFGTGGRWTGSKTKYKTVREGKIKTKLGFKFRKRKISVGSFEKYPGAVRAWRGRMPAFRMMQRAVTSGRQFIQRQMESEIARGIEREAKK